MVDPHPVLGGPARLRGRGTGCAPLDGMIAAVREGESRTLVVRGEAGLGKTPLEPHPNDPAGPCPDRSQR